MDGYELQISKIAAAGDRSYYRNFVYVETEAMLPTGLYSHTRERIEEVRRGEGLWACYWEEYGLVDGLHLVTRAQLDDGAALINGKLEDIRHRTEERSRYVTPYNLVIAAHGSPFNNGAFDQRLKELMDDILKGKAKLEDLVEEARKLPKRVY